MRTTPSIDDDVLHAARERAGREGTTVGAVLSALARSALTQGGCSAPSGAEAVHAFAPLPQRGAAVTNALINTLREDGTE